MIPNTDITARGDAPETTFTDGAEGAYRLFGARARMEYAQGGSAPFDPRQGP